MTEQKPIDIGWYCHFKGEIYQVFGVIRHTETLEWMVLYGKSSPELARPYDNFCGWVEVDGKSVRRFKFIDFTEDLDPNNRSDAYVATRLDELRTQLEHPKENTPAS
jgi:hypothetical protein